MSGPVCGPGDGTCSGGRDDPERKDHPPSPPLTSSVAHRHTAVLPLSLPGAFPDYGDGPGPGRSETLILQNLDPDVRNGVSETTNGPGTPGEEKHRIG